MRKVSSLFDAVASCTEASQIPAPSVISGSIQLEVDKPAVFKLPSHHNLAGALTNPARHFAEQLLDPYGPARCDSAFRILRICVFAFRAYAFQCLYRASLPGLCRVLAGPLPDLCWASGSRRGLRQGTRQ